MGVACSKHPKGGGANLISASEIKQLLKEDMNKIESQITKKKSELRISLNRPDGKRVFKTERDLIAQLSFQDQLLKSSNLGVSACITLEQYDSLFTHHQKQKMIPKEIEGSLKDLLATLMIFSSQHPQKYNKHLQKTETVIDRQFGKGTVTSLKNFENTPQNLRPEALQNFRPTDDLIDQQLYEFCISEKIYDLTKVDKIGHQSSKRASKVGTLEAVRRMSLGIHVDDVNLLVGNLNSINGIGESGAIKSGREGSIQLDTPKFSLIEASTPRDSNKKFSQFKDGERRSGRPEDEKQFNPAPFNRASFGINLQEINGGARGSIVVNGEEEELNEGPNSKISQIQRLESVAVKQERNSAFTGRNSFGTDNSRVSMSENLQTSPEKRIEPNTLENFKPARGHIFQETALFSKFEEKIPLYNPVLNGVGLLKQKFKIDSDILGKYPKYPLKQGFEEQESSLKNGSQNNRPFVSFGREGGIKKLKSEEDTDLNVKKEHTVKGNNKSESIRRSVVGSRPLASETKENFEKLRSELAKSKEKYVDPIFRAEGAEMLSHKRDDASMFKNVKRFRPCNTLNTVSESVIGEDGINPSNVRPGSFTDPDFASIVAVLAEYPRLIKNIIYPHQFVPEGVYSVAMNESGEWKIFLIDDILPGELSAPAYTTNTDRGLWVGLLEKAYAKSLGSYQAMSECSMISTLITLTGLPCESYELGPDFSILENSELLWSYLSQIRGREYLILAKFKGRTQIEEDLKLDPKRKRKPYSFALLDAKSVLLPDGTTERVVKLRDRWGAQFSGNFSSPSSKLWTAQTKKALGFEDGEKDVTWFTYKEFLENFSELYLAKLDSHFSHTSLSVDYTLETSISKNVSFVWIKVDESTPLTLLFTQRHSKQLEVKGNRKEYKYSYIRVGIGRLDQYENITEWNGGDFRCDYQVSLELYLERGEYLLVTETFWEQKHSQQLTIGAYSEFPVWMETKPVSGYQYQLFLEQLAIAYTHKMMQAGQSKAINSSTPFPEILDLSKFWSQSLPGLWFCYYKNENLNYIWQEEIKISFTEGTAAIACLPDLKDTKEQVFHHEIEVLQRSDKIILIKFANGNIFEAKTTGKSKAIKKP